MNIKTQSGSQADAFLQVRETLFHMGRLVEKSLDLALQGLLQRQIEKFAEINAVETSIDKLQVELDRLCLGLLDSADVNHSQALEVLCFVKINKDLERMGDEAVNIKELAESYLGGPNVKSLIDIHTMARSVRQMVQQSLAALTSHDLALAHSVLDEDTVVDQQKKDILATMSQTMSRDAALISGSLNLILIARSLERLADHATNIAENVILILTEKDVRHSYLQEEAK
jgi:phosphate transport system protein